MELDGGDKRKRVGGEPSQTIYGHIIKTEYHPKESMYDNLSQKVLLKEG